MKIIFLGFFVITGLFAFGIFDEVNALSEKGAEKGKATACEEDNPGKAKNNPHCISTCDIDDPLADCDQDSIPNADDLCPLTPVGPLGQLENDWDGDGFNNNDDSDRCDPNVR